ncbi:sugar phosphate isomerase/epimerase family protein [Flavihumibacter petaseus]|uniref:Putative sugar dehydratase n=1 Tax=Flavihumibacter petaseus NBRC 106054 TaxID=1220578 RepID=A0A0E9N092_9BACT|nr:sugar phosphate isomerase/epimerase [Flavihumibacter petaseus]GAO43412.1 putative sugar dehydratase [Flavihumibacter petaseus NBRC 106054]
MKQISILVIGILLFPALLKAQRNPGVVSYTFRDAFAKDVSGTLDTIKAMGIDNIEFSSLFGQTPEALKRMLDERGMFCTSYGVSYGDLVSKTDEVGKTARLLGASFVRVAWIPHDSTGFNEAVAKKAAEDFNRAGQVLKEQYGIQFCYHNHGYEFADFGNGTYFDYLMQATRPEWVGVELDILWVYFPGKDPVEILKKYGNRIYLMHLKDLKPGIARSPVGGTSGQNNVPLGQGQIDMRGVLKAAKKAKVRYQYIEDESDRVFRQVPESLKFLKELK